MSSPPPSTQARAVAELVVIGAGLGLILSWSTSLAASLAAIYVLGLCTAAAWCLSVALGRPRLAQWAGRAVLSLALPLAWAGRYPVPSPPDLPHPRGDFPSASARVWQEMVLPAEWREIHGETWVYVGLDGAEPEQYLESGPVLEIDGTPLVVELDPWAPQRWVRARFSRAHLGQRILVSFGFARPRPGLTVFLAPYYRGSTLRMPSSWTPEGALPPPGHQLPLRTPSLLGRLAGQSPVAANQWRLAIEARLIDPDSATPTAPARILAGCY